MFQKPLQRGGVQQIHRHELPSIEDRPVVEHAGQSLGLFQGVYRDENAGRLQFFTGFAHQIHALVDVGTLRTVIDGQLLVFDGLYLGVLHEAGLGHVKGEGQKPVAVRGGIHRFKSILFREGLV